MCYLFVLRELLTPQQHYDWGLRALKTVLRGCGNLLQIARQVAGGDRSKHRRVISKYKQI